MNEGCGMKPCLMKDVTLLYDYYAVLWTLCRAMDIVPCYGHCAVL